MTFDPTESAPRLRRLRVARTARYLTCVHPVAHPPRLLGRSLVIGRQPGPDGLTLADGRASRAHAELAPVRGQHDVYRLRDLDSKNGTFLDGRQISQEYLQGPGVIRIGDTVLIFSELSLDPGVEPPRPAVGRSPAMALFEARARRAGASGLPILVEGPSGAGKERLSQLLHEASGRPGPLVAINCATFSGDLLASELFGHVRGAFSGADASRGGLFASARGGTLFLDEIAEMPLTQQPALLRALQEGRVRPVGADREVAVDVRIVAASHQDLRRRVEEGRFRGDLYARLAGVHLVLPGLEARREEILPLFREFLGDEVSFDAEVAEALALHDWPYNVRELQHVARAAHVEVGRGGRLSISALPAAIREAFLEALAEAEAPAPLDHAGLVELMRAHRGNVAAAARAIEISRQALYRRLEALSVDPTDYREPG